jgi:hypothetical protein
MEHLCEVCRDAGLEDVAWSGYYLEAVQPFLRGSRPHEREDPVQQVRGSSREEHAVTDIPPHEKPQFHLPTPE